MPANASAGDPSMGGGSSGEEMSSEGMEGSAMQGMGSSGGEFGDMGSGNGMGAPNMNYGMTGGPPGMSGGGMEGMGMEGMGMGMPGMEGMGMGMPGMDGMGGMGMMGMGGQFAPPEDPAPSEEDDYLTKGRYAFSIGKEKEGIEHARAFAIAATEGVDILQKTKWFAADRRAVGTIRFAVGVVLEAPATMTDFKPIGSQQFQGGGGGGGGMGAMGSMGAPGGGGAAAAAKNKEHALYDLTGTFGEAVIGGFKERWSSGNFGTVFNDVEKFVPKTPVGNNNGMGMMGMGMRGGPPGMGMEGSGMEGMAGMGMGMEGMSGMPGEGQSGPRERIMPNSIVSPGFVYIGSAEKQADLMPKAVEKGVDAVIFFDVKVSGPNRLNGIVQNEARVRVVSLKGDMLGRSSELLNTKVERALMSTDGEDEVTKATEKFFMQLDDKVKLTELPAMKPEHAKARLVQVLSSSTISKLEKLFEVSLYHSMKLITDEEKTTACLIVMEGSEGESLANGRPEDKQALIDPLLPNYK